MSRNWLFIMYIFGGKGSARLEASQRIRAALRILLEGLIPCNTYSNGTESEIAVNTLDD